MTNAGPRYKRCKECGATEKVHCAYEVGHDVECTLRHHPFKV